MVEDLARQFVSYDHYLECSRVQNLKDRKDLEDILTGKKDPIELELSNQESMQSLPMMSSKRNQVSAVSHKKDRSQASEGTKKEEKISDRHLMPSCKYDHDYSTFHCGIKRSEWDQKIEQRRISPFGKSRAAPFTLAELHCKDQLKDIQRKQARSKPVKASVQVPAHINKTSAIQTGNQSVDELLVNSTISLQRSISPTDTNNLTMHASSTAFNLTPNAIKEHILRANDSSDP